MTLGSEFLLQDSKRYRSPRTIFPLDISYFHWCKTKRDLHGLTFDQLWAYLTITCKMSGSRPVFLNHLPIQCSINICKKFNVGSVSANNGLSKGCAAAGGRDNTGIGEASPAIFKNFELLV